MINETLARRAKENMSFSDYKPGSATAEYNAVIAEATAKIEKAKAKVSPEAQSRLDSLLSRYKVKYAEWTNKYNANGAGHVSVMISGPSGYNMRKHEKYLSREGKLWAEYDDIKDIDSKISAIVDGDRIIKSDDADAIEKLKEKLAKALEEHQGYKDHNAKARREGKDTLPAYVLTNSNGRIKGIKDRIARLEKLAAVAEVTPQIETEINGIKIVDNLEAQRLQIIFPGKPDAATRDRLKKNGFRWSPTSGAWQSYRNYRAETVAKEIAESYR
jgi:hypothetical protein